MQTVLRGEGFRFVIIPGDHEPPDVHIYQGDGEVKIELDPVKVKQARGMTQRDAELARRMVMEHRSFLLTAWDEINGKRRS